MKPLSQIADEIDAALAGEDHAEIRRLGRMAARRGARGRELADRCRRLVAAEHAANRAWTSLFRFARKEARRG